MRRITRRQFDAFCYARQPLIRRLAEELAWFEAGDRKLFATIVFDRIDRDFGFVILGRDARRLFRCVDLETSLESAEVAEASLRLRIREFECDGRDLYPQGDEVQTPNEIFRPVAEHSQLHPYFRVLAEEPRFEAARNLIREIAYSYVDVDGHYIKEFQTQGFNARL